MPNFWSDRPVLVTGATGLIGSWLVKSLLKLGARVAILLRDPDPLSELYRSGDLFRTTTVNGAFVRTIFANNQIPLSQFSARASNRQDNGRFVFHRWQRGPGRFPSHTWQLR